MKRTLRSFLLVSALAATVACGWARAPKPQDTTFTIGQITCDDSRILDVSGTYEMTSNRGDKVSLTIVQDSRGKLVADGSASLLESQGDVVPISMTGKLQLSSQGVLTLTLDGSEARSGVGIHCTGTYDGSGFNVSVQTSALGQTVTFNLPFVPQNPARGFTISDAPSTPQGKKNLSSMRTVTLPWGTQQLSAKQQNKGNQITFTMRSSTFGLDLRATLGTETSTLTRNSVKLGYGSVNDTTSITGITPSAYSNN